MSSTVPARVDDAPFGGVHAEGVLKDGIQHFYSIKALQTLSPDVQDNIKEMVHSYCVVQSQRQHLLITSTSIYCLLALQSSKYCLWLCIKSNGSGPGAKNEILCIDHTQKIQGTKTILYILLGLKQYLNNDWLIFWTTMHFFVQVTVSCAILKVELCKNAFELCFFGRKIGDGTL